MPLLLPLLHTIEYIIFCYETLILFAKWSNSHLRFSLLRSALGAKLE